MNGGHHRRVTAFRFICDACRQQEHEHCEGRGRCDCQHKPKKPVEPATGPPGE